MSSRKHTSCIVSIRTATRIQLLSERASYATFAKMPVNNGSIQGPICWALVYDSSPFAACKNITKPMMLMHPNKIQHWSLGFCAKDPGTSQQCNRHTEEDKQQTNEANETDRPPYDESLLSKYIVKFWCDKKPSVNFAFLLLTMADSVLAINRHSDSRSTASVSRDEVDKNVSDNSQMTKSLDALVRLVLTEKTQTENTENWRKWRAD